MANANSNKPDEDYDPWSFVGRIVKLRVCDAGDTFYEGCVEAYDDSSGKHVVAYRDSQQERQVQLLDLRNENVISQRKRKRNSKRSVQRRTNSKRVKHVDADAGDDNASDDNYGLLVPLRGEAALRFENYACGKLKLLFRHRRDASGKRPGMSGYDPKTLYLPQEFLKSLPPVQRQWWEFKSRHMDKVLFFRIGKFFELFEMDAHVGVQELGLQYMKGEQPHCGFPEKNLSKSVEKLACKGYRVLVVEQIEIAEQLEQCQEERGSKDKVIKREICAIITKGTMTEGWMLDRCPDSNCMLSITEECQNSSNSKWPSCVIIGVCIADASTSRFILGQFSDDTSRSCLRSILSEIRPVELIKPDSVLSKETERVLRDGTRKPLVNNLFPGKEFWDAKRTLIESRKLFSLFLDKSDFQNEGSDGCCKRNENEGLPDIICHFANAGKDGHLALSAFGGCFSYLRQVLLDQSLLKCGTFEILPCSESVSHFSMTKKRKTANQGDCDHLHFLAEPYMVLDAAALENLEIFENSHDCCSSGTMFAQLDHCVTPFGKRLLKRWLARPLKCEKAIRERQDAIAELKGFARDAAVRFQKHIVKLPDIERLLARLFSESGHADRNPGRAVFHEEGAKYQVNQFIRVLRGCQRLIRACDFFRHRIAEIKSVSLQQNVTLGKHLPDLKKIINKFEVAFDWPEAEKAGRIMPSEGTDKEYDIAKERVQEIETELRNYLESQRIFFGDQKEINYVTVGREQYLLEIPESLLSKVPHDYENRSSRKGFRRFLTPSIKELCQVLNDAQTQKEKCLRETMHKLIRQFCHHHASWRCLINVVAELDALISLAFASNYFSGPTCRPVIRDITSSDGDVAYSPYIHARVLGHPILSSSTGIKHFVPNSVDVGGEFSNFLLITGPNMGGKSTLIRQVCLAVILAQLGCNVPAEDFELSPVDRIFVRMGAKDHIMNYQSTFLVEMLETASMLSSATQDSLIAIDELGRGTATSDGQAIAHAVLDHLTHKTRCRGMFSTHYQHLVIEYENDPMVHLCHMAFNVGVVSNRLEEISFLYKLMDGACPRSYGVNVACLAGLPDTILQRAVKKSTEFERSCGAISIKYDEELSLKKICEIELLMTQVLDALKQINTSRERSIKNQKCLIDVWHKVRQKLNSHTNQR